MCGMFSTKPTGFVRAGSTTFSSILRKRMRSAGSTPSISAMTVSGRGSARSSMSSTWGLRAIASSSSLVMASMRAESAVIIAGVNAFCTKLRKRR